MVPLSRCIKTIINGRYTMRIIFSILFFAFLGFSEINSATELTEERVADLIESMSVEEKVAQMFMVEIGSITPEEVEKFKIGAILNGGGSFPYKKKDHIVEDWVKLADEYFLASIKNRDKARIPIIWGTDAVHGLSLIHI